MDEAQGKELDRLAILPVHKAKAAERHYHRVLNVVPDFDKRTELDLLNDSEEEDEGEDVAFSTMVTPQPSEHPEVLAEEKYVPSGRRYLQPEPRRLSLTEIDEAVAVAAAIPLPAETNMAKELRPFQNAVVNPESGELKQYLAAEVQRSAHGVGGAAGGKSTFEHLESLKSPQLALAEYVTGGRVYVAGLNDVGQYGDSTSASRSNGIQVME
ncbi:hypothetical protein CYMTET_47060, partial [Cymbomonas tetramitiformis]